MIEMAPDDVDSLIAELAVWCKAKHGRQKAFAELMGVSEQLVSNWLAKRKTPTWKDGLRIQTFLAKQRRGRK
jgi:transcriptional regulator with XRE-family HTH domain